MANSRPLLRAANTTVARIPIIAITTNNSISVKPFFIIVISYFFVIVSIASSRYNTYMSTDDKKAIVWKRSTQTNQQSQSTDDSASQQQQVSQSKGGLVFKRNTGESDVPVMDIAQQSSSRLAVNDSQENTQSIDDLRAEIENAFSGDKDLINQRAEAPLLPITSKANITDLKKDDLSSVDSLKMEIEKAFGGKDSLSNNSKISKESATVDSDGTSDPMSAPLLPITSKANIDKENSSSDGFMSPPSINSQPEKVSNIALDNHEALVASLKADIKSDFDRDSGEGIENSHEETKTSAGVGQTYYSDLSKAMGANEPATMSELIKKSRFEKKESMILSPGSKKNILYIIAAILLLALSIGVISRLFSSKKDPIEFTSEERVSSLVYADQDTGINVTGLESEKTKQVIRSVVEKKIPEDTINQIYYVEKTPEGSAKRLGVKDIFDRTDNETPKLLYDNIDNEFTHGVYRTDKNYPFIILKALSYDRALEGMKEWEPTMLDDLATYFDLPPEATDRSLIKDGYEDDLIRNKNVRVSRYLPREVDGRGILDFLRFNQPSTSEEEASEEQAPIETTNSETGINTENAIEVDQEGNVVENISEPDTESLSLFSKIKTFVSRNLGQTSVFAQQSYSISGVVIDGNQPVPNVNILLVGTTIGAITDFDGNYTISNIPAGRQQLQFSHIGFKTETVSVSPSTSSLNITLAESAEQLDEVIITVPSRNNNQTNTRTSGTTNQGASPSALAGNTNTQRICYQITKSCIDRSTGRSTPFNASDPNQFCSDIRVNNNAIYATPALEADIANYSCISAVSGGDIISQITTTEPICFNNQTGERLSSPDTSQFCLDSYQCNLKECRANGIPVQPGSPGAQCGLESTVSTSFDDPRDKVCKNYTHLLNVTNINNTSVCFDNQSNYLPYNIPQNQGNGFSCVAPQNRSSRLCITRSNQVVVRTGNEIFTSDQFCFQPNQNAATNIGVNSQCSNLTTAEIQSRLSLGVITLRLAAGIGQLFGLSSQDTGNLNNAANTLAQLATTNVLQEENIRKGALVIQTLETVLDKVDPNLQLPLTGPNGGANLYAILRGIIEAVKCTLGIGNTLQWTTLAQIPQGVTIFAGQSAQGVEPVQQVLALIGLMDPISINGKLDLVTQDAISQFQLANSLNVTGILDPATLAFVQFIVDNQGALYGDGSAIINDYFVTSGSAVKSNLSLGAYNEDVQSLQVLLYAQGYQVNNINGLFDDQTCSAVLDFQKDNDLELADPTSCEISSETLGTLNDVIRNEGYLGSGFKIGPEGFLQGVGALEGGFGPGVANFEVNQADADTLREGDIVLMYMFLDEETILIARNQSVIDEIIKRRAFSDIFKN